MSEKKSRQSGIVNRNINNLLTPMFLRHHNLSKEIFITKDNQRHKKYDYLIMKTLLKLVRNCEDVYLKW